MKSKVRLIHTVGHNKYYVMEQIDSTSFKVVYGKISSSGTAGYYPMSQWIRKYNEKIAKGYVDVSQSMVEFSLEDVFKNLDLLEARLAIHE